MDNIESATMPQAKDLGVTHSTVIDLTKLTTNPENYDFFTFRPNLEKLILSGKADTKHISILWYTVPDGKVKLHYHAMTESVYTIEGTQTDTKGTYPTGSLYFNPPGSGHEISNSSGFFLLAYAAPPDFVNTDAIEDYTPVQLNMAKLNLQDSHLFSHSSTEKPDGIKLYDVPLDPKGGMSAVFIESTFLKSTSLKSYQYTGNYLLVLAGSCSIDGTTYSENRLVVAKTVEQQSYQINTVAGHSYLLLGLSF